jgi:acetolactate synthase-1/2/3 large subunit
MDDWTGGRAVVELLKTEGVRHIFGIVGSTFLDVLDRLYDDSSVEYINVRHEQAAAFMAAGLARVTDRPGVCLVTSGPGATNLITGVAAAYVAHSPVVALVGGIALDHYQKDAFQEFDLLNMFRPVTKLARCRQGGAGRGRPAIIEIPIDPDEFPTPAAAVRRPD